MHDPDLTVGRGYTKEEIERAFNTNFGNRISGIILRRDSLRNPYTIIFSRARGPYTDKMEGESFYYDGEGLDKDQELTTRNKALAEANFTGRVIYGFRQETANGLWYYLGILQVLDYSYVPKNGFMTYEFHLNKVPVSPAELIRASKAIAEITSSTPNLTSETHRISTSLTARSAAFRTGVKQAYDNTCAICSRRRFSVAGYPEVQAAHIYPKEMDGADDYRNGLALCRLHHWAFDSGLLALSDRLTVLVRNTILNDNNYEEISQFINRSILLPQDQNLAPHSLFVREHRALHGF